MLEVSGICKSYGKHRILNGVSFSAGPGQCVGIVGTNGCGKTTLLSILAGALRADSGSIRINGTEILGRSGAAADLTAYVPQENPLIGELSVKDNLLLWHRGSRKEMEKDLTEGWQLCPGDRPHAEEAGGYPVRRHEKAPQHRLRPFRPRPCPHYGRTRSRPGPGM